MEKKKDCRFLDGIYKTSELKESTQCMPKTAFEVEDWITLKGSGLHFDMTDRAQGVFFIGNQGELRCTEVYENDYDSVTIEIPEYLHGGNYTVELRRKNDGKNEVLRFAESVKVKGYMELYGLCIEDYWEGEGFRRGREYAELLSRMKNRIVVRRKNTTQIAEKA